MQWCFPPLISLKTVNEQRERKVGKLLWLSNDWDSVSLVRSQAQSRPYLSPMIAATFPICITVFHSKLCWTTKKFSLCILHLLCSNVCRLSSMWSRSYQGLYSHFINRQKAPILHAHCPACKQLYGVLYITFNVSIWERLSLLKDANMLSILPTCFRFHKFLTRQKLFLLFVD